MKENNIEKRNKMQNKKQTNKKGQEEVMGFVIIILIVIIIGVVFFAFSLRRPSVAIEPKQAELDDLINSMLAYTTDCELSGQNQTVRELLRQCNNNPSKSCKGQGVCVVLNTEIENILKELLREGAQIANAYVHGYALNITNFATKEQIVYKSQGNLSGDYFASSVFVPTLEGQDIEVKLKYYYSKD